jgi:hypothetical protein
MAKADRPHAVPSWLDARDLAALRLAVTRCREHRADQIDHMLATRPWHDVSQFCAYDCQIRTMNLKPWQTPPCYLDEAGEETGAALLRRMLRSGVSRFHPDPLAALEGR